MEQKPIKPKSCILCPVVKVDKDNLVCGVKKELKADKNEPIKKLIMWKNCPLEWGFEKK